MIAAATFGNIMEQGGNQNQLRVGQARPQFHAQRVAAAGLFFGEAFQLQQHADRMFINRIGMKEVKLHLAHNMRPLRHIGPQYAVTVHRQQPPADRPLVAQHAEENRARFRDIAQRLRQVAPRVA